MVAAPQDIEALISAVRRRDQAQLTAWLDQFSTPAECYSAVRALAESLAQEPAGPLQDVARWAWDQRAHMLDPST